jgi:hypothetical protein
MSGTTKKRQIAGKKHSSPDQDSGIEVLSDAKPDSDLDQDSPSAALELQNWIMAAFTHIAAESAPPNREPVDSTVHEWYYGPTYFYSLQINAGKLTPELLETTDELNEGIGKLVPRLKMPKYIQEINITWLNANDLTVHSEVSFPSLRIQEKLHTTRPGRYISSNPWQSTISDL